jgi:hypothetical protein
VTALARAVPRRGDGMTTIHNSNSRQQKNAPPKRGKLGISGNDDGTQARVRVQYRQQHELTAYRKPFLLSELRVAALRCRLWAADLDSVGVALKADLITPEQALELLDPHALAFVGLREGGGAS